jgi:excisionase family DNA binding protein
MSKLLTKSEAAMALRISMRTLERYIVGGLIPAYKVGRKHLIEEKEIDKFLKRNRAS